MPKMMSGGWVILGVAAVGCGTQASEDFSGEVLLSLRGSVSVDPLSAGPHSVPALCFDKEMTTTKSPVDSLPDAAREAFAINLPSGALFYRHIVDVEARGSFPAEFDVDVFTPPPTDALTRLTTDEALSGFGWVCAVASQHKPVAQPLTSLSFFKCETPVDPWAPDSNAFETPAPCVGQSLRVTQDGSRYFHKTWDCENGGDLSTCDTTLDGDDSLLREAGGFEGVYGASSQVRVVYLSEPAPPGSYTAYKALAPEGLPAGYHLRPAMALDAAGNPVAGCDYDYLTPALEQTNKLHGTSYTNLPTYQDESLNQVSAPDDVVADFQRIAARLEMEACPLDKMIIPEVPNGSLSIDLMPKDNNWEFEKAPWIPPASED